MIVARLELTDFRNYRTAALVLEPGVTVLVGPNGQGKTNLVEAIGYLAAGASHRVAGDQSLIREGEDRAIIRARLQHGERAITIEAELNRSGPNRLLVNRAPVKSREARRFLDSVIFAPEDLALVRGDPAGRRRFLDGLLAARQPRLAGVLADYERVLRQRNTLLKSARASRITDAALSTLEVWDERLAEAGTAIIEARAELVAELAPHAARAYQAIAGTAHDLALSMRTTLDGADPDDDAPAPSSPRTPLPPPSATTSSPLDPNRSDVPLDTAGDRRSSARSSRQLTSTEDLLSPAPEQPPLTPEPPSTATRFLARLSEVRRQELDRGLTLVGPHRDDLLITLNGMPARTTASHGESWSTALALKLGSAELLRETGPAGDPVLVLDDVFAELDAGRRSRLVGAVAGYEQVLVTAAVAEDVPAGLTGRTVRVRAGELLDDEAVGGEAPSGGSDADAGDAATIPAAEPVDG